MQVGLAAAEQSCTSKVETVHSLLAGLQTETFDNFTNLQAQIDALSQGLQGQLDVQYRYNNAELTVNLGDAGTS